MKYILPSIAAIDLALIAYFWIGAYLKVWGVIIS